MLLLLVYIAHSQSTKTFLTESEFISDKTFLQIESCALSHQSQGNDKDKVSKWEFLYFSAII